MKAAELSEGGNLETTELSRSSSLYFYYQAMHSQFLLLWNEIKHVCQVFIALNDSCESSVVELIYTLAPVLFSAAAAAAGFQN